MSSARLVEDRLRAEYVELLPSLQRMLTQLETEVLYSLLPLTLRLDRYERILVRARLKECESAQLRGLEKSRAMKGKTVAVLSALREFELEFDRQIDASDAPTRG